LGRWSEDFGGKDLSERNGRRNGGDEVVVVVAIASEAWALSGSVQCSQLIG